MGTHVEDYLMGPLFTRVSFRVRCPFTAFGETVVVCGELPELGDWDPTSALPLHTTPETFPLWQSDAVLIGTYVASAQFKFAILGPDGSYAKWEDVPANRLVVPVGEEITVAEEWGQISPLAAGGGVLPSPELAPLDPAGAGHGLDGGTWSLDLPPSLAEQARRVRAPALAEPLDGTERVLMVVHRLPLVLHRDDATGNWSAEWDETSMWATNVDGGKHVLGALNCRLAFLGSPGRKVPREEQPRVTALLESCGCYPVYIEPWELSEAYQSYTKTTLWPLLHNELPIYSFSAPPPPPAEGTGEGASGAVSCVTDEAERAEAAAANGLGNSVAPAGLGSSSGQSLASSHYRRSKDQWSAYQAVNALFANAVKALLQPKDLVWVHGHHLLLVPERVSREARHHGAPIGLFVHTPFPSSTIFSALPQRKVVLEAMLHSSIIGFHLYEYARNFMISARRLLGLVEPTRGTQNMSSGMLGLEVNSRQVVISVSHVGVEPSVVERRLRSEEVSRFVRDLQDELRLGGRVAIGGVEWLSSVQGAPLKLMAYESLLENYEKWRGRVTMVQVCVPVPTRTEHSAEVAAECREIAARIRARFGEDSLRYAEVGAPETAEIGGFAVPLERWCVNLRVAIWSLLSVLVVSASRDGLNLLPFEYVCVRRRQGLAGVCVLSEFAGCSRVLNGAIRVNPFSLTSIVEAIDRALSLDAADSEARMRKDANFVQKHTMTSWVQLFAKDLKRVQIAEEERMQAGIASAEGGRASPDQVLLPRRLDVEPLVRAYRAATRRVLIFGLDGTLIPQATVITHLRENHDFVGKGQAPSPAMLHCLRTLAADPANEVHVLSGRGAADMAAILGGIERLGLAAELGYLRRPAVATAVSPQWERHTSASDNAQWRQEAKAVMHWYTTRTNGAYSRWQESAAVWCYHDSDPDFGRYQGMQLHKQLSQQLASYPVSVVHSPSKCTVEVRIRVVNKGVTTDSVLCQPHNRQADFVLCCGDDHSDEYMFAAAIARARAPSVCPGIPRAAPSRRTFNITVGRKPSRATLYVEDTRQVLFFLQALSQGGLTGNVAGL